MAAELTRACDNGPVNLRLSPSAAGLWAQCPRRWWYRYVDKLPEPPPGEPAVLGTFVHEILELLLAQPAGERTPQQARVLAREVWERFVTTEDWLALGLDDRAALRFRQRAWSTLEAYYSCEDPAEVEPVAQELSVEVELDGVPFRGFIDLVAADPRTRVGDGPPAIVVTDYKTGRPPEKNKPWSAEQEVERLWQPQWYAAALAELGEHEPVRARLLYFTALDARRGPGFDALTAELAVEVTEESTAVARAELRRRWDAINDAVERGQAEATPGPLCGWCPFVAVCEAGRSECSRRWEQRNEHTGARRLRDDAPAVALLGLAGTAVA
jgi:putative RecB family exonuclease